MTGDGRLVTAIVRGDHEVNETKLANAVKAVGGIRPATVEEIKAAGMEPGYGSPIGAHDTVVVVDDLVARSPNLVAGANREGFHYRNVNVGRDFTADVVADITNAQEGDRLPDLRRSRSSCATASRSATSSSSGRSSPTRPGRRYLGEDGVAHPIVMGSYGIGVGRNVACIVEAHHDEKGIVWPAEVAPYAAHLVSIGAAKEPRVDRDRRAPPPARDRRRPTRSCGTTATSRRASSSPTPSCSGMPWILTVSPALARGGRRRGHRARDRRAGDAPDRGGRGAAQRRLMVLAATSSREARCRTSASCSSLSVVPSSEMTASPPSSGLLARRARRSRDGRGRSRPRPCRRAGRSRT